MKIKTIKKVFFSPAGTTKKVIDAISTDFTLPTTEIDLLRNPLSQDITLSEKELLIIALPVYFGRLPDISINMLENLKGENTLAVVVVVYGNRAYDDALLELNNHLTNNGFIVIGAAAFIGQHSIFPIVAANRPNKDDIEIATDFSKRIKEIISCFSTTPKDVISIPGNDEYCKGGTMSMPPKVTGNCSECGVCASICPVNAIDPKSPQYSNGQVCITCAACIANCPKKARNFTGLPYKIKGKAFSAMCSKYRTPEVFYLQQD